MTSSTGLPKADVTQVLHYAENCLRDYSDSFTRCPLGTHVGVFFSLRWLQSKNCEPEKQPMTEVFKVFTCRIKTLTPEIIEQLCQPVSHSNFLGTSDKDL